MKKHFISNLALLILLNLLIKPFWFFGIEVGVQNRVGEEVYGFYFSLFSFAFILNMLLDLGINNYNNRAISRDHSLLKGHLAAIIPLKFVLFLVYAGVVLLTGKILGYTAEQFALLWMLVLNQFLASFILYFRSNISGLQYFRTDSLLSVMDRSLMILFTGLLLRSRNCPEAPALHSARPPRRILTTPASASSTISSCSATSPTSAIPVR